MALPLADPPDAQGKDHPAQVVAAAAVDGGHQVGSALFSPSGRWRRPPLVSDGKDPPGKVIISPLEGLQQGRAQALNVHGVPGGEMDPGLRNTWAGQLTFSHRSTAASLSRTTSDPQGGADAGIWNHRVPPLCAPPPPPLQG